MRHPWIDEIKTIVKETPDRYAVHLKCKPLLEKMAASRPFLYDIIRHNLSNPDFFQRTRSYPTLSLTIVESSDFTLVVNIFPSLPDKRTDISFQSIHHHGSLLLSTVGAIGPGYQSILFNKDFVIHPKTAETNMSVAKVYQNEIGKVEFVDANQPHIVFYPEEISATYAFWCDEKKQAKEAIKKISFLKKFKRPAAQLINRLNLSKVFGLNKIEYFDFYVDDHKIIALKDRLAYAEVGDNDNFLQNIFFFIQQTGFRDTEFLIRLMDLNTTPASAKVYIDQLINGVIIEDRFFSGHLNIPKVNLLHADVLNAVKGI